MAGTQLCSLAASNSRGPGTALPDFWRESDVAIVLNLTHTLRNEHAIAQSPRCCVYIPSPLHTWDWGNSFHAERRTAWKNKKKNWARISIPSLQQDGQTHSHQSTTHPHPHTHTHTHKQPSPPSLKCGQPAYVDDNRVVSTTDMSSWWYMRDLSISVLASSQLTTVEHPPVRSRGG